MKKSYQVDDRKPSSLPKIGSVAVAIGSLSLAATSIAPSVLAFANLSSTEAQPNLTESSASTGANPGTEPVVIAGQNQVPNQVAVEGSQLSATNLGNLAPSPTAADPLAVISDPALTPLVPASGGNVSAATPVAGASGATAGSANSGNISSATPAGGVYEDDDDDEDEYEREEHDDDDDDDDEEDDD